LTNAAGAPPLHHLAGKAVHRLEAIGDDASHRSILRRLPPSHKPPGIRRATITTIRTGLFEPQRSLVSATKGNYGINVGNTDYGGIASGKFPTLYLRAPFASNTSGTGPLVIGAASVTDGLSNTHFVSEILPGANDDTRGTVWFDDPGSGSYMTRFTPNGQRDFLGSGVNVDVVAGFVTGVGHSPPNPGELCDNQPVQMLGCFNSSSEGAAFGGSRSRHSGGVNTLFGDGSVHFIKNSINPTIWVGLGSISAGEVISSDSY
jgi:prepilin-type processing-associated H-X9-DG protein